MKYPCLALACFAFLPLVTSGSSYSESLQRLSVEDPEFVFYADFQNDFNSAGKFLSDLYLAYLSTNPDMPPIPVNFSRLFEHLGVMKLLDITAASQLHPESGYINQMLFRFEDAPTGLFLIFGDSNQPFRIADQAPVDADLVAEFHLNGVALFQILRSVVIDIMGPLGEGIIEGQMNQPLVENGPTLADLIMRLTTRVEVAMKPEFSNTEATSTSLSLLKGHLAVRISDVADMLVTFVPILQQMGFVPVELNGHPAWKLNMGDSATPITVLLQSLNDSNDLLVSFREDTRNWFMDSGDPISTSVNFRRKIKGLPTSGISFWYSSHRLSQLQIANMDAQFPDKLKYGPMIEVVKNHLLKYTGEQVGISILEPDAYRVINFQPVSYKTNIAVTTAAVPIGIAIGFAPFIEQYLEARKADKASDSGEESTTD